MFRFKHVTTFRFQPFIFPRDFPHQLPPIFLDAMAKSKLSGAYEVAFEGAATSVFSGLLVPKIEGIRFFFSNDDDHITPPKFGG